MYSTTAAKGEQSLPSCKRLAHSSSTLTDGDNECDRRGCNECNLICDRRGI